MIQIPTHIAVDEKTSTHDLVAAYLEQKVEEYAVLGWEFYRVDEIGVWINPGCLSALFGRRPTHLSYYVITFRAPARGFSHT